MQLAKKSQSLRRHICDAIRKNSDIATQSLSDQWRLLVLGPISKLSSNDFVLHNISPSIVEHDIMILLEYNLGLIKKEFNLPSGWPSEQGVVALRRNATRLPVHSCW